MPDFGPDLGPVFLFEIDVHYLYTTTSIGLYTTMLPIKSF
nr:MAG TPA: hypothetical protein [Siphoviridae sp. ctedi74]